jgi:3-methyladenine DNA glycosylase AlkD
VNAQAILRELKPLGRESYKKVIMKHGVREPCLGVKIEDLKRIQRRLGMDYHLALELFDTGVYDAMYLAGLLADDARMTERDLQYWVEAAYGPISKATVPWVAAGSPSAMTLALKWIESGKESIAAAGWGTLGSLVSVKPDEELDLAVLKTLMKRISATVHGAPNDVRSEINGFLIAAGCHVAALTDLAIKWGGKIGPICVDVGNTACKVPFAPDAIDKVKRRGAIGRKRKTAKC